MNFGPHAAGRAATRWLQSRSLAERGHRMQEVFGERGCFSWGWHGKLVKTGFIQNLRKRRCSVRVCACWLRTQSLLG
eukprot:6155210-Pleurochrysis_carterae.AAC.1